MKEERLLLNVLIVDDDEPVRSRLQRIVLEVHGHALCVQADSLAQARAQLALRRFDLALVDVGLPDGSGIELVEWMQTHAPQTESVIVSSLGDDATVLRAIRGGATGYLLKNGDDVELELSLRSMQRGGAPIDPVIARRILHLMATPPAGQMVRMAAAPADEGLLSEREVEVLELVAQGQSNREIAQSLFISVNTVECHAKNIYRKLAVHSRAAAVHSARGRGLLP
ncbi:MAG: response regulator transcription factor [Burkholderiales bacterium]|jgi:DNA-binding NarL/FixJ family response regulator|uniref:LuxR C-terminal-related transcriptional regulator n=1 Tax=Variovorax paradoxus TaxID=34073 RepID=UPI0004780204|nr:response regulator transcription factor [Variovorax paradoxus]MBW8892408.1 response regulator transcription factor [Burkholderiales bacterium]